MSPFFFVHNQAKKIYTCHLSRISGNAASNKNIHGTVSEQLKKNFAKSRWKVSIKLLVSTADCGCVYLPGPVLGKSPSCLMVAASISCGHGDTSDAETGAQQWSAPAAATAATTAAAAPAAPGHGNDRVLHRQSKVITNRSNNCQSYSSASKVRQHSNKYQQHQQQLRLRVNYNSVQSTAESHPISTAWRSQLYFRNNKRFQLFWADTRTALINLFQKNAKYLKKRKQQLR